MKLSHCMRVVLRVAVLSIVLLGGVYVVGYGWIQWDAHQKAKSVWSDYPQALDAVDALILRMQDEHCSMKERNRAVWALGRLADEQALTALQQEYTGKSSCFAGRFKNSPRITYVWVSIVEDDEAGGE